MHKAAVVTDGVDLDEQITTTSIAGGAPNPERAEIVRSWTPA